MNIRVLKNQVPKVRVLFYVIKSAVDFCEGSNRILFIFGGVGSVKVLEL